MPKPTKPRQVIFRYKRKNELKSKAAKNGESVQTVMTRKADEYLDDSTCYPNRRK